MMNRVMNELEQAKDRIAAASKPLLNRARQTAGAAGDYVRESPWAALGIALAAGMLIGVLTAKR